MVAASMGAFGTYKTQYLRYLQEREELEKAAQRPSTEVVWVTRRYDPLDLRNTAPVPRHKLPPPADEYSLPQTEPTLRSFERQEPDCVFASFPSTRDEHWSTLREMLPSRGSAYKRRPPSWGIGQAPPPIMIDRQYRRMPKVNSPMSRYTDEVHTITHHDILQ
ncbi:hypothetical protein ACOMHN_028446 [Nucella lapillus]